MNKTTFGPFGLYGVVILSLAAVLGCGNGEEPSGESTSGSAETAENRSQAALSVGRATTDVIIGGEDAKEPGPDSYEAMVATGGQEELISEPPAAPQKNVSGMSEDAMRIAAYEGRASVVERGLDGGIDINAADPGKKHTALHMAAYNGHTDTVRLLLSRGAEIDCRDAEGKTPLSHACTGPFAATVQLLVDKGADVNAKDTTEGFTPLMMAAALNQPEIVKILLANGADKDAVDEDQDKAIDHARNEKLDDIVELLK